MTFGRHCIRLWDPSLRVSHMSVHLSVPQIQQNASQTLRKHLQKFRFHDSSLSSCSSPILCPSFLVLTWKNLKLPFNSTLCQFYAWLLKYLVKNTHHINSSHFTCMTTISSGWLGPPDDLWTFPWSIHSSSVLGNSLPPLFLHLQSLPLPYSQLMAFCLV